MDEQWADYINAPECNPVSAIFEKGRRLLERKQFVHSDKLSGWEAFCVERLGISARTADRFIVVARDQRFETHGSRIPPSWRTLYELTKLDNETFQAALDEGEFGRFCEMLPFSLRTAQRLMAIATDARLSNTKHVSLLPQSWRTLYELTKLDDETFQPEGGGGGGGVAPL